MEQDAVTRSVVLDATPEEAWAALTEPEHLSAWLGGRVKIDVRPGGRGAVTRVDGTVRRLVVEAVEPGRALIVRWWPYEEPKRSGAPPAPGSRVEFLLEPHREGALLTVREHLPETFRTEDSGDDLASAIGFVLPAPDAPRGFQAALR
jgi:uncharacterized protein YndB with AHSA1/START domain